MQNALQHEDIGNPKGGVDFTSPATDQGAWFESYIESECRVFTREQQARQSRVNGSSLERQIQQRGRSDENDDEIEVSHSSIAIDPLRRPRRRNFCGRMCRESVCGV
jgi:hypothetical protein